MPLCGLHRPSVEMCESEGDELEDDGDDVGDDADEGADEDWFWWVSWIIAIFLCVDYRPMLNQGWWMADAGDDDADETDYTGLD